MSDRMHENHDLDLLAALAEGRLADTRQAEELLASCPECAELYRAHSTVLEAVRRDPAPELTELESRRLRAAVWNEVGTASPPAEATEPAKRGVPGWYRLLGAAAALAVIVGVGGVLVTSMGGGGDAASDTTGFLEAAAGTTAADEEIRPMAQESAPTEADTAADTTAAAADTMPAEDTSAGDVGEEYVADGAVPPPAYLRADVLPALDAFLDRFQAGETEIDPGFECPEVAEEDQTVGAAEAAMVEDDPVWFVALRADDGTEKAVAVSQADCQPVPTSE